MAESPRSTPPLYAACVCGHMPGDHKSNRAPFAGRLEFGVCLRCDCRKYRHAEDVEAENQRLRQLLATLGWGPSRLSEHLAADADPGRKVPPTSQ